jgi:hypothetical protein
MSKYIIIGSIVVRLMYFLTPNIRKCLQLNIAVAQENDIPGLVAIVSVVVV